MRAAGDGLDDMYGPTVPLSQLPRVDARELLTWLAEEECSPVSLRTLAKRLGVDAAVLCRPLTLAQADRYATALGTHPGTIWGADWWNPGWRSAGDDGKASPQEV